VKFLYFILIIPIVFLSCVSEKKGVHTYPNPFEFTHIYCVAGSKNDLFLKANEWVTKTFVSVRDVIKTQDKEAGKIIAKGAIKTISELNFSLIISYTRYTMTIDVKDGKYRVVLSDFIYEDIYSGHNYKQPFNFSLSQNCPANYVDPKMWNNIKRDAKLGANEILKDFIESVSN